MEYRQPIWAADDQDQWRKGPWTPQEDKLLVQHVNFFGEGNWNSVSKQTGLRRSGKSCRLRWVNYLRPDLKRGKITPEEETVIMELHALWGNRWSAIARSLPGRTDNEIKNYWRTHFKKSCRPSKKVEKARAQYFLRLRKEKEEEEAKQKEQYYYEQQQLQRMLLLQQQKKEMEQIALLEQEIFMDCVYPFSDHRMLGDFGGGDGFGAGGGLAVVAEDLDVYAIDDDVHQLVQDLKCLHSTS